MPNFIDAIVGYFSPVAAARRARARLTLDTLADHASNRRRYEAASKSRRTTGWRASATSANTEVVGQLGTLRDRHRDLVRNNPWAARAVQAIVTNTVGTGIVPRIADKSLAKAWAAWGETKECDADGVYDFYGLQAVIARSVAEAGECLVRRRMRRPTDGLTVPMQLQILEPDHLDTARDTNTLPTGGRIIGGIELDGIGRRVAYWLLHNHPGDSFSANYRESTRIPADDVLHIYRQDRPGQLRGVPWGAPAMLTLRDLDDYEDAYLLRNKLANCMTAFVYDSAASTEGVTNDTPLTESLEPGAIELLPPGKDIKFTDPPTVDGYGRYTKDVLYRVAAAYGITFEALTGDLSQVNFSSARLGWLEMQRNLEQWRWHMLIPQLCAPVAQWFAQAAELAGRGRAKNMAATWTPPRREMIDPTKEVPAALQAIRGGLVSLSEYQRQLGNDAAEMLNELAADFELADSLGLSLECDGRKFGPSSSAPAPADPNNGDNNASPPAN